MKKQSEMLKKTTHNFRLIGLISLKYSTQENSTGCHVADVCSLC